MIYEFLKRRVLYKRKKEKIFKILSSIMMDNYVGDNVVFFVLCVCFENVKYVI